ncbi:MAG: DUF839 domain-containing protein [Halioglobus sp.]
MLKSPSFARKPGVAMLTALALAGALPVLADKTPVPPQMAALTAAGWGAQATFTVGESVGGYTPPGILDGMYAWNLADLSGDANDADTVRVMVNHELSSSRGYSYSLASGASLTGARVSYFDIDRDSRAVVAAGLGYNAIYNRQGRLVYGLSDLLVAGGDDVNSDGGLNRLCSANGVRAGEYGFVDDIFFTGEETGGGTEWALDVKRGELWAVPAMGRAAWESVAAIDPPDDHHVALLIGDDRGGAPLLLYVGEKNAIGNGSFLDRNGLAKGRVYAWAPNSASSPEEFNGTGNSLIGPFKHLGVRRASKRGEPYWDEQGYAGQAAQDFLAVLVGAFRMSRPEDLHTNPNNGSQVVFASTGRDSLFPSDAWGTTYLIDISWTYSPRGALRPFATVTILYDGDDAGDGQFAGPDFGIRSPDNLTWANDGYVYIQEDRSVGGFGQTSGEEASIWRLDPDSGEATRIAQMDRNVVAPTSATDPSPGDIGNWESSGIIDVTDLFPTRDGEVLLFGNVQAHSLRDGVIGGNANLAEGGQLFFLNHWQSISE